MKCHVCGKNLSIIFHHEKLNLCEPCFDQIRKLEKRPDDPDTVRSAASYFTSLPEQTCRKHFTFNGVTIPITDEYARENPTFGACT